MSPAVSVSHARIPRNQYEGAKGEVGEIDARIKKAKAAHLESIAKRDKAVADLKLAEVRVEHAIWRLSPSGP